MSLAYLCHGLLQLLNLRISRAERGERRGKRGRKQQTKLTRKWITDPQKKKKRKTHSTRVILFLRERSNFALSRTFGVSTSREEDGKSRPSRQKRRKKEYEIYSARKVISLKSFKYNISGEQSIFLERIKILTIIISKCYINGDNVIFSVMSVYLIER